MAPTDSTPETANVAAQDVSCCGPAAPAADTERVTPSELLIITDSCCNPAAAPLEERAVKTVNDAIAATGMAVQPRLVSATDALAGALSQELLAHIQSEMLRGASAPMVMIDGQIVASGLFSQQDVETALADQARADA